MSNEALAPAQWDAFGEQASQIRFVPLEQDVVMLVGSNLELLEESLANIQSGNLALAEHPALLASREKLDTRHKLELHMSASNLMQLADNGAEDYSIPSDVTSAGLVIEEGRFGFDLWMPHRELMHALDLFDLWNGF